MKKKNRLPNVILMSQKTAELLERQTTENVVCLESEAKELSVSDSSQTEADMDKTAQYRNIVQLWHPAREKPHCIGTLLCWRIGGTFFVHEHYCHDEQYWRMFISENEVKRYCYLSSLEPDCFEYD